MIFKYSELKRYIAHLKKRGEIVPLCKWDNSNAIILRHDVDFSVEAAYRLAKIEMDSGIRSTFFFLTTCHTYNIFSAVNRRKIREMSDSGFEIGLHFDPEIYGDIDEENLERFVDRESAILSYLINMPIKSVSLHNPSVHHKYSLFKGYLNAYDETIFSDERFISDSQMDFRGKDPYKFADRVKSHPVQILLHPLHYTEEGLSYPDIFYQYLKEYIIEVDEYFRVNSKYKSLLSTTDLFTYIINKKK